MTASQPRGLPSYGTPVENHRWKCRHQGGHSTTLRDHERMERPPHYVICPDCGTHWIVYGDPPHAHAVIYLADYESRK